MTDIRITSQTISKTEEFTFREQCSSDQTPFSNSTETISIAEKSRHKVSPTGASDLPARLPNSVEPEPASRAIGPHKPNSFRFDLNKSFDNVSKSCTKNSNFHQIRKRFGNTKSASQQKFSESQRQEFGSLNHFSDACGTEQDKLDQQNLERMQSVLQKKRVLNNDSMSREISNLDKKKGKIVKHFE